MAESGVELVQSEGAWLVRVTTPAGKVQEYYCATERQARTLLATLGKADLKPAAKVPDSGVDWGAFSASNKAGAKR
jgi:hypothetical protein